MTQMMAQMKSKVTGIAIIINNTNAINPSRLKHPAVISPTAESISPMTSKINIVSILFYPIKQKLCQV